MDPPPSPLARRQVLVARPKAQAGALVQALEVRGATPVVVPLLRIVPPEDPGPLREAACRLADYDWVLFTSRNAVDALFDARPEPEAPWPPGVRVASVGPATSRALGRRGAAPTLEPEESLGDALASPLLAEARTRDRPLRVLFPRAEVAREVLPETLAAAGVDLDLVVAYRTLGPDPETSAGLRRRFLDRKVDVVLLTSSSTIQHLVEALGSARERLTDTVVASIGPRTTETAASLRVRVDVTASTHTQEGLIDSLEAFLARAEPRR